MACLKLIIVLVMCQQLLSQRNSYGGFNQFVPRPFQPQDRFQAQYPTQGREFPQFPQQTSQDRQFHQFSPQAPTPIFNPPDRNFIPQVSEYTPSIQQNRQFSPQNPFLSQDRSQAPQFSSNPLGGPETPLSGQIAPSCSSIEFINKTESGWHGNILLTPAKDLNGVEVEIGFDEFVPAFANNLGHSSSHNNQHFLMKDENKNLKAGEKFKIEFFAKSATPFKIPLVTSLRLNNAEICSNDDYDELANEDKSCGKIKLNGDETGGRWDGILTIFPKYSSNGIRVDIELDESAWALGNDLGYTKTSDQKRFTIFGRKNVRSGSRLLINFFVKFNELDEIPEVKKVFVDGVPICIFGSTSRPAGVQSSVELSPKAPKPDGIFLSDLPLDEFPQVTQIPLQVDNSKSQCGTYGNSLQNRLSRGVKAEIGQFPFHVAIFRNNVYICGASLISEKTVLTAGHCVVNESKVLLPIESFKLLFGAIDLKSLTGAEALRDVSEINKHPDYDFDTVLKQDIALMMIRGSLQFSPSIKPICLFDQQIPITNFINQTFTVLGFGSNENSRLPSRYLNHGQMSIISRQQCIESKLIFGLLPEQSAFCAKAVDSMIACPGDSGGGLIFIENGKYFLRGISSVTITGPNGQCDSKQSVAFTDVSFFLTWIRENIRN